MTVPTMGRLLHINDTEKKMNLENSIFPCSPVKYLRIFIHRHYDEWRLREDSPYPGSCCIIESRRSIHMSKKHTLNELNNMSREDLITIVLTMQGQLDTLNDNIEKLIEQVRLANQHRFGRSMNILVR